MALTVLRISSLVLAFLVLFQHGSCLECQDLETGDMSAFDISKYEGKYDLAMGIMGDGPLSKVPFKCNVVNLRQHSHPNGGLNVVITMMDNNEKSVMDSYLGHMDLPTDLNFVEIDAYHATVGKWTDMTAKFLLATDDIFVYSSCFINEDNKDDIEFAVTILRKQGSNLTTSKIQAMLPESIKSNPGLASFCDN